MLKESSENQQRQIRGGDRKSKFSKSTLISPPYLQDLGLDKKTSSLAQQVAELSDEQIEKVKNRGLLFLKVEYH